MGYAKLGGTTSPQEVADVASWGECSVQCREVEDCTFWHWEGPGGDSPNTCTLSKGGFYGVEEDVNFVVGSRECGSDLVARAVLTCGTTDPTTSLPATDKSTPSIPAGMLHPLQCIETCRGLWWDHAVYGTNPKTCVCANTTATLTLPYEYPADCARYTEAVIQVCKLLCFLSKYLRRFTKQI